MTVQMTNFSLKDAVKKTKKDHAEERHDLWKMSHEQDSNQYYKDLINWLYNCILSMEQ